MVSTHRPLTEVYLVRYPTKRPSGGHLQPEPKANSERKLGILGKECIIPNLRRVKIETQTKK